MIFPLLGCTNRTDYLRRYADFLRYSLGDFTVLERRTRNAGVLYRSRVWELQFTRQNGKERIFVIDNAQPLAASVIWGGAYRIFRDALKNKVAANYFMLEEFQQNSGAPTRVSLWAGPLGERRPDSARVLDPQKGLQLYSVTPQELVANWGFNLSIEVRTQDQENHTNIIERLKAMTWTLSAYLEQDEIVIRFILSHSDEPPAEDINFIGIYNRQTDKFITQTFREITEKRGANFVRTPLWQISTHLFQGKEMD